MTDPVNTDAALVRASLHPCPDWDSSDRVPGEEYAEAVAALDRLAAAAERAEQAERDAGQAWTEYNDSEAALLAAQQELDLRASSIANLAQKAERAEATNTQLRDALAFYDPKYALDVLAPDAEQENA